MQPPQRVNMNCTHWLEHNSCGVTGRRPPVSDGQQVRNGNVLHVEGTWSVCCCLHVLWVVLQTSYELCDWLVLKADLIHCAEQWEPGRREETLLSAKTIMDGWIVFSQ